MTGGIGEMETGRRGDGESAGASPAPDIEIRDSSLTQPSAPSTQESLSPQSSVPSPKSQDSPIRWVVWARRGVQSATLLLFLYLAVSTRHPVASALPVDLFLRLDPLIQLSASIAGREWVPYLFWSVPLLLATLIIGRFFCGWLCPLGTVLDLTRLREVFRSRFKREKELRGIKYLLLAAIVVGTLAGSTALVVLDPITLLTRSFALVLYPAFNAAATGAMFVLYDRGILPDLMVWADTDLRASLLPAEQPFVHLSWLFLTLFAFAVAANLVAHRFWCRYLCPLGALLSLLSRISLLGRRVSADCAGCGKCQAHCRMGAVEPKSFAADVGECVLCAECDALCPDGAVSYGARTVATSQYDVSRRNLLAVGGLAALGVAGLRADASSVEVNPFRVRPPGARDEKEFLERCVRCGQCMKVCPTSGLQPSLLQAGLEGLWTPVLASRIGPCNFDCVSCGQVCPTSAIQPLKLEVKRETIIGTAYIDQKRCLPWADGRNCIVCEEMCPVSPKAVVLEEAEVVRGDGEKAVVKRPRVIRPRCIGCGICEYKCPLPNDAAIRVYNTNALLAETTDVS